MMVTEVVFAAAGAAGAAGAPTAGAGSAGSAAAGAGRTLFNPGTASVTFPGRRPVAARSPTLTPAGAGEDPVSRKEARLINVPASANTASTTRSRRRGAGAGEVGGDAASSSTRSAT